MNTTDTREGLLLGCVIGDALGRAADGLGRGHLQAHMRSGDGYWDPTAALKGKMERWVKPGLYGSITQFMLLAGLSIERRRFNVTRFRELTDGIPSVAGSGTAIFRQPGHAETLFIASPRGPAVGETVPSAITTRLAPMTAALALVDAAGDGPLMGALSFGGMFTRHPVSLAAIIITCQIFARLADGELREGDQLPDLALQAIDEVRTQAVHRSDTVFRMAVNPDSLIREIDYQASLIRETTALQPDHRESHLVMALNRHLTTPVTRATVDDPRVLLPYAVFLASRGAGDPGFIHHTAREGGSASALTAMAGALAGGLRGMSALPETLCHDLVNRTRINALIATLAGGGTSMALAEEFVSAEASLTAKENEERAAKNRHGHKKPEKPRKHEDLKRTMARHVVESWTKVDKARWKKERQKDRNTNDE